MFSEFNSVLIIHSIKSEETLRSLRLDILHASVAGPVKVDIFKVRTPEDLLEVLEEVAKNFSIVPIIHLAAHGDETGIRLLDGFIEWKEVLTALEKINVRLKNSLIVVLALCLGAHMAGVVRTCDRAPFNIMLSPTDEIGFDLLERLMTAFYKGLLKDNSFQDAVKAMFVENGNARIPFISMTSVQYVVAYRSSIVEHIRSGKARHNLFKEYKILNNEKMPYEFKTKIEAIPDQVDMYDSLWKEYVSKFLMIDLLGTEAAEELAPYLEFKGYYYQN